jgi:hypothetical protein
VAGTDQGAVRRARQLMAAWADAAGQASQGDARLDEARAAWDAALDTIDAARTKHILTWLTIVGSR